MVLTEGPTALWAVPVSDLAGVARHVLDVARAGLPGWRLVVLTPPGALPDRLRDLAVTVVEAPFGPDHGLRSSTAALRDAVRRHRPAVVHTHLAYADIVAALAVGRGPRLVTTEHGIARDDVVYHLSSTKVRLMEAVHTVRLRRFHAAIAVSRATAEAMAEKWHPRREVVVVPNGVDPVAPAPAPTTGLRILSLARLSPEKRLSALVDGFAELHRSHPEARLTLAGTGAEEPALRAQVSRLGLDDVVRMPGFVDPEPAMAEHDVLAMMSVWENCSYALLDAAVRGLGVVASDVGGNPEILPPAALVRAEDTAAVAAALATQGLDLAARPTLGGWPTVSEMCGRIAETYAAAGGALMARIESPWDLPDKTVDRADDADREIRITDFALLAVVPFRSLEVSGIPVNEVAMAALVGLCLLRPSRGAAKLSEAVVLLLGALLALLVCSGLANQIDWTRRVGHVVILAGIVWAFGTGRVSLRSAAAGLATGLTAVIALALVGVGGDGYSGRLTGFLADPNAGAYFLAVLGVLAVFFVDDRWRFRALVAVPIVAGLVLTYSRTGLLAAAFAVLWILLGRRLGVVGGAGVAAGLVWLVDNVPDDLALYGPFSNRSGSDALRERIIAQERVELADAPWFGHGPGTARVEIGNLEFFFHNSYLATRQEGGWGALLLVLALLVWAFLQLSRRSRAGDLRAAAAQAAIIGIAVMAVTLGEVLLDTPMAIAVGMALGCALLGDTATGDPDG